MPIPYARHRRSIARIQIDFGQIATRAGRYVVLALQEGELRETALPPCRKTQTPAIRIQGPATKAFAELAVNRTTVASSGSLDFSRTRGPNRQGTRELCDRQVGDLFHPLAGTLRREASILLSLNCQVGKPAIEPGNHHHQKGRYATAQRKYPELLRAHS